MSLQGCHGALDNPSDKWSFCPSCFEPSSVSHHPFPSSQQGNLEIHREALPLGPSQRDCLSPNHWVLCWSLHRAIWALSSLLCLQFSAYWDQSAPDADGSKPRLPGKACRSFQQLGSSHHPTHSLITLLTVLIPLQPRVSAQEDFFSYLLSLQRLSILPRPSIHTHLVLRY